MKLLVKKTLQSYEEMKFRDVCKNGFHEFQTIKDDYLVKCSNAGPRKDLIEKWIEQQLIIMYPITPHYNEMAFIENFLPNVDKSKYPKCLIEAKMPEIKDSEINLKIIDAYDYLSSVLRNIRLGYMKAKDMKKGKKK